MDWVGLPGAACVFHPPCSGDPCLCGVLFYTITPDDLPLQDHAAETMNHSSTTPTSAARFEWRSLIKPLALTLLGLTLTAFIAIWVCDGAVDADRAHFRALTLRLESEVVRRVELYRYGLRGVRSVYSGSASVQRGEFRTVVGSRNVAEEFPGAMGIGYITRVRRDDVDGFLSRTRQDDCPAFALSTSGTHDELCVIEYLEPREPNRSAIGVDIAQEPSGRSALERAMLSGDMAISRRTALGQTDRNGPGFLCLLPVYRTGSMPKTPALRRSELQGWVFMPLVASAMFSGTSGLSEAELDFELFEGEPTRETLIYDSDRVPAGDGFAGREHRSMVPIRIAGADWTLAMTTTPAFQATSRWMVFVVAISGGLLWILLGVMLFLHMESARRSLAVADAMVAERTRELRESEERFALAAAGSSAGIWDWHLSSQVMHVSERWEQMFGYGRGELPNCFESVMDLLHPDDKSRVMAALTAHLERRVPYGEEFRIRTKSGAYVWVEGSGQAVWDESGKAVRMAGSTADIQARKSAEQSRAVLMALQKAILDHAGYSIITSGTDGLITGFNPAAERLLGYTSQEMVGRLTPTVFHDSDEVARRAREYSAELGVEIAPGFDVIAAKAKRNLANEQEWTYVRKDGTRVPVLVSVTAFRDAAGEISGYLGMAVDISDRKRAEQELERAALQDKLTGLPNRVLITDRIEQAITRSRRTGEARYAVLFLDFDRFKVVNDTLGHEAGDRLLLSIADRLRGALRETDSVGKMQTSNHTAARLGGDEFVVLLDNLANPQDAEEVAARLVRRLAEPHDIGGQEVVSTASIGVVRGDTCYERAGEVLADADTAMYEAKAAGKGRFVIFDEDMRGRVQRRAELERAVRLAGDRDQFMLHFQPVITLGNGRMEGVEALLRWNHPLFGLVSPDEFIPIAEETGAIAGITDWVVRAACAQIVRWRSELGNDLTPQMSVNISGFQLSTPGLAEHLAKITAGYGLSPEMIGLEITESAIMRDRKAAVAALTKLRSAGFRLTLDDFGAGSSSLSTLHEFPLDVVKLDRTMIAGMSLGRQHTAMLQAVISLADNLHLKIVAEGVETADQLATLEAMDCRFAQGRLFGPPVPGWEIMGTLLSHRRAA